MGLDRSDYEGKKLLISFQKFLGFHCFPLSPFPQIPKAYHEMEEAIGRIRLFSYR